MFRDCKKLKALEFQKDTENSMAEVDDAGEFCAEKANGGLLARQWLSTVVVSKGSDKALKTDSGSQVWWRWFGLAESKLVQYADSFVDESCFRFIMNSLDFNSYKYVSLSLLLVRREDIEKMW